MPMIGQKAPAKIEVIPVIEKYAGTVAKAKAAVRAANLMPRP